MACLVENFTKKSWYSGCHQKLLKPAALGRNVVEDAVKHEAEAKAQALDVVPGSHLRVDLGKSMMENRDRMKTGKRKDMHGMIVRRRRGSKRDTGFEVASFRIVNGVA
jgi:hypothetical protein